ncbi:hypothetical protein EON83_27250 [bacterium]|nr:MAG: hypothetical protein EON83_27250 [bacterium]
MRNSLGAGVLFMIVVYIFCAVMTLCMLRIDLDRYLGTPFVDKVEVREHRFVQGSISIGGESSSSPLANPDSWNLRVGNDQGQGWVGVTPGMYEKTKDGDKLFVRGIKGKFTGHWYLEYASKKRLTHDNSESDSMLRRWYLRLRATAK